MKNKLAATGNVLANIITVIAFAIFYLISFPFITIGWKSMNTGIILHNGILASIGFISLCAGVIIFLITTLKLISMLRNRKGK